MQAANQPSVSRRSSVFHGSPSQARPVASVRSPATASRTPLVRKCRNREQPLAFAGGFRGDSGARRLLDSLAAHSREEDVMPTAQSHSKSAAASRSSKVPAESEVSERDISYDLISVLYHSLKGAELCAKFIDDAEAAGD